MTALRRWSPWLALALVLVGALAVGAGGGGAPTRHDRVRAIAETLRCPQCDGETVAGSNAPSAVQLRTFIADQVDEGRTDDEIRDAIASSYRSDILLTPPRTGVAGLVWVIPVVALIVTVVALGFAFRRWRGEPAGAPTDADRELVERARREASS